MDATLLLQHIALHIDLTPEETTDFTDLLLHRIVKKRQFLVSKMLNNP